ncbi:hypothetical protein D3C79_723830 [compost metagenome]
MQRLFEPLRVGEFGKRQTFGQVEMSYHLIIELLIVDDGHRQGRQTKAGALPGHATCGANGKIMLLHQLCHLIALVQQHDVELRQLDNPLLQLGPEGIGTASHQSPLHTPSPGHDRQAIEREETGPCRVCSAETDQSPLPLGHLLMSKSPIGGA